MMMRRWVVVVVVALLFAPQQAMLADDIARRLWKAAHVSNISSRQL